MINTAFTSPFDAPPAGGLVAVDLDPRRQAAHRAIAGYLAGYSGRPENNDALRPRPRIARPARHRHRRHLRRRSQPMTTVGGQGPRST